MSTFPLIADLLWGTARDMLLALFVAIGWGVLFGSPRRVLWVAGLLGGFGHAARFLLLECGMNIIPATLCASLLIGLCGIFFAHRTDTPPVVFTMPACITMIPGMFAYRSMIGGIRITSQEMIDKHPNIMADIAHNVMLTFCLLVALAVGISVSVLLFRKRSVRDIKLPLPPLTPWH